MRRRAQRTVDSACHRRTPSMQLRASLRLAGWLALALLIGPARAQDEPPDDVGEGARALLERAGPSLATDAWWGIYRAGRSVGATHLVVRPLEGAVDGGGGLRASATCDLALGDERL